MAPENLSLAIFKLSHDPPIVREPIGGGTNGFDISVRHCRLKVASLFLHRLSIAEILALYRSEIRDELQCLTTGIFAACSIINAGKTVHQGIEAGLDATLPLTPSGDSVTLTAAYTYNDFNFDGDPNYGDNELPGVPKQYLRAELLFKSASGIYAGPSVEWAPGHYFADNANSLTVDPYALLNLKAGFDAGAGWSLYVEGRNLTDKHYISTVAVAGRASAGSQLFNPGIARSVFAGVRYKM